MKIIEYNGIKTLSEFERVWKNDTCSAGISDLTGIFNAPSCDSQISDLDDINGAVGYYELSGQCITELESAYNLFKRDLFLVSQARLLDNELSSRKISYDILSTQLFDDILAKLKFKSMAYEEKYEYAVSSHNHDRVYSKVNIQTNPKYTSDANSQVIGTAYLSTFNLTCNHENKYSNVSCNPAHASTAKTTKVLRTPKIILPLPPKPMIGTLRFIGIPTLKKLIDTNRLVLNSGKLNVNPYNSAGKIRDDYDGWVFPNGSTFENRNSQLSSAAKAYAGSASANFTVPSIENFFKCNPGTTAQSNFPVQASQTGMKRHIHDVGACKFNGDITLNKELSQISCTSGNDGGVYVHQGDPNGSGEAGTATSDFKLHLDTTSFTNLKTTQCAADTKEPWPDHYLVPVMIYIGGETEAYYSSLYGQ